MLKYPMSDRVFIAYEDGKAIFRVSKAGKSVFSENVEDFTIREDFKILRGVIRSRVEFSGSGTVSIPVTGIAGPYRVSVQAIDGALPSTATYFAYLRTESLLEIHNVQNVVRSIRYCVFGNHLDEGN